MSLLDDKNDNVEKLFKDYIDELKNRLKSEIFIDVMNNYNYLINRYEDAQHQIDILKRHIKRLEEGVTNMRVEKYNDSNVFLHIPSDLITDIKVFEQAYDKDGMPIYGYVCEVDGSSYIVCAANAPSDWDVSNSDNPVNIIIKSIDTSNV